MKQQSYTCSCITCKQETNSLGIATHFLRKHGTDEQRNLFNNNFMRNQAAASKKIYDATPKKCKECENELPYDTRHNTYCSHKCSAIFTNRNKIESGWKMSDDTKSTISSTLIKYNISIGNKSTSKHETIKTASGPFSKIHFISCKFCEQLFTSRTTSQVCQSCQDLKWQNNKDQYSFRFSISQYPDLFDINLILSIGWVSFGGKRGGPKNPKGLSRDHRVSVNDAKKFKYDPYYISHPINCQLMPHTENNKKKGKSSISYQRLVYEVIKFNTLRGDDWIVASRP